MVTQLLPAFIAAFLLSAAAAPAVSRLARVLGAVDQPSARKIHAHPIPRLGGVGIALAWGVAVLASLAGGEMAFGPGEGRRAVLLGLSLAGILLLGAADDVRERPAARKLAGQLALGGLVYAAGVKASGLPGLHALSETPVGMLLDLLLTCLWMAAACNAMNLVDGMDGLSSGTALVGSLVLVPLTLATGDSVGAVMLCALAGALTGFLYWNRSPSVIFLGDAGSLFLGWILGLASLSAALSLAKLASSAPFPTPPLWLLPPMLFAYPLLDTASAILRRLLHHDAAAHPDTPRPPWYRRILAPDRSHLHHRLLDRGLTPMQALLRLLALHGALSLLGVLTALAAIGALPLGWPPLAWLPLALAAIAGVGVLAHGTSKQPGKIADRPTPAPPPPPDSPATANPLPAPADARGEVLLVTGNGRDLPRLRSLAPSAASALILHGETSEPAIRRFTPFRRPHPGARLLDSPWDLGRIHRRRPIRLAVMGSPLPRPGDQRRLREQLRRLGIPVIPLE